MKVIEMRALAQATAIKVIAEALKGDHASDAAQIAVAREYINMYSDIGQKSNTMFFSDRPADINALMAQAATVVQSLSKDKGATVVDTKIPMNSIAASSPFKSSDTDY